MPLDHLTPTELARLSKLEAALAALDEKAAPIRAEREKLLTLNRVRAHRARQKPQD